MRCRFLPNKRPYTLRLLRLIGHQDWINFSLRRRIIRFFFDPDTVSSHEFEVEFFGLKYNGNLNCTVDWNVYLHGAYEKHNLLLLKDLLSNKGEATFIDVGAHVGHHSIFMSKLCKQVHSFEPYKLVRSQLEEKIAVNNIKNIIVHDVGLGDANEELDFYASTGNNTGAGLFLSNYLTESNSLFGKLRVVKGDEYIAQLKLNRIDLIKIDVEGFEKNVLVELRNTISTYHPIILMELSKFTRNTFSGVDELMAILPPGYRIESVDCNRPFCLFFNRSSYHLSKFDFQHIGRCDDVLLRPP